MHNFIPATFFNHQAHTQFSWRGFSKRAFNKLLSSSLFLASFLLLSLVLALPSLAAPESEQQEYLHPMDSFNFQGFVQESKAKRDNSSEPENLVRLHVHPDLYQLTNQLIDAFQEQHAVPFRLHQGDSAAHSNFVDDGYVFDLILSNTMTFPRQLLQTRKAKEIQVLAVGRLGLWAPLETVRSTRVIELQTGKIGLMPENSIYHAAALDVLDSVDLLPKYAQRLHTVSIYEDIFEQIKTKKLPLGFLPWNRLVAEGLGQKKEVLKLESKLHESLVHGIALTNLGSTRAPVIDFWEFIFSDAGRKLMQDAGFD